MEKIKLDKLNDVIINSLHDVNSFMGYTVTKHFDINQREYELKDREKKYYYLISFSDYKIFVSEDLLLRALLEDYIELIESGEIYSHGYPESRLIPSNHTETCQNEFLDSVNQDIMNKVSNIISEYFKV